MKLKSCLCTLGVLSLLFAGCQSKAADSGASAIYNGADQMAPSASVESIMTYDEAGEPAESPADPDADFPLAEQGDAKRIYYGSVTIETKDFTKARNELTELTEKTGGFLESENLDAGTRSSDMQASIDSGWFVLRVPADKFDTFMNDLSEVGSITYSARQAENITRRYMEVSDNKEALETQLKRLNELMAKAENISDIIAIEEQISDVEQQLKYASSDLASMDLDLDYSRVTVTLVQVTEYSPTDNGFWGQIQNAFSNTWIAFAGALGVILTVLIYLLPWFLVALVIGLIIFFLAKRKKKQAQKDEEAALSKPDLPAAKQAEKAPEKLPEQDRDEVEAEPSKDESVPSDQPDDGKDESSEHPAE